MLAYNIELQYLEIKVDVCHDQYTKVNLVFLFISLLKLFLISVSSSHSYLLNKCPKSCLSWLEENLLFPHR